MSSKVALTLLTGYKPSDIKPRLETQPHEAHNIPTIMLTVDPSKHTFNNKKMVTKLITRERGKQN